MSLSDEKIYATLERMLPTSFLQVARTIVAKRVGWGEGWVKIDNKSRLAIQSSPHPTKHVTQIMIK